MRRHRGNSRRRVLAHLSGSAVQLNAAAFRQSCDHCVLGVSGDVLGSAGTHRYEGPSNCSPSIKSPIPCVRQRSNYLRPPDLSKTTGQDDEDFY